MSKCLITVFALLVVFVPSAVWAGNVEFTADTDLAPTGEPAGVDLYAKTASEATTVAVNGALVTVTDVLEGELFEITNGAAGNTVLYVGATSGIWDFEIDTAYITATNGYLTPWKATCNIVSQAAQMKVRVASASTSYNAKADGTTFATATSNGSNVLTFNYYCDAIIQRTLTVELAVQQQSGGGGTAGVIMTPASTPASTPTSTPTPTPTPAPALAPVSTAVITTPADVNRILTTLGVARDTATETRYAPLVSSDAAAFRVTATEAQKNAMTNFVSYGISSSTQAFGAGERRAILRDYLETVARPDVVWSDVERLATGQKPVSRNLPNEQGQLPKVLTAFEKLTGHRPDFKKPSEDLAWNTMMYRVRFDRDLAKERAGIVEFKVKFKKTPTTPLDWATVRAYGYALD